MPRSSPATAVLSLGGAPRQPARLDDLAAPARAPAQVLAALGALPAGVGLLLAGGEPTTRADLLELLRQVRSARPSGGLWLRTDGLALTSPSVVQALQRAGVDGVRIPLHSGRADAHDWLVGLPGAARRVIRALGTCAQQGLPVEVEITLTRPTLPYLVETVALVARLGVRALWIRRLRAAGAAAADFIALSPRLGMVRAPVEEATLLAEEGGLTVRIEGLPRCTIPGAAHRLDTGLEPAAPAASPCATCPGLPSCAGAPQDYTARFGWVELWRQAPPQPQPQIRLVIPPDEPSRSVRIRLIRAARQRPERLRLVDLAAHPDAAELLREAQRLSVPRVEVCGRTEMLDTLGDAALFRLRGLARIDALAADPDAVPALRARLARLPEDIQTELYAVVSSGAEATAMRQVGVEALRLGAPEVPGAWAGAPELAGVAGVPLCLGGAAAAAAEAPWAESTPAERGAVPTDRLGDAVPCPHAERCGLAPQCPGLPPGWGTEGIAPREI